MPKASANRITIDPDVMAGRPVIAGPRMPVELVLAKLAADPDLDELFLDYPGLTVDDEGGAGRRHPSTIWDFSYVKRRTPVIRLPPAIRKAVPVLRANE